MIGQMALVVGRCRAHRRNSRPPGCARRSRGAAPARVGTAVEAHLDRPRRRRGDGEQHVARRLRSCVPIEKRRRAAEAGERSAPEGEALRQRRRRDVDRAQQFAGRQDVPVVAGHEVDRRAPCARRAAARPQRVDRFERGRSAKSSRRRAATCRYCRRRSLRSQILNDISSAWLHSGSSGAAVHSGGASNRSSSSIRQVAASSRPADGRFERGPVQGFEVDECVDGELRLGKQPRAAGEPGIALKPAGQVVG